MPKNILALFARNESKISQLYKAYSKIDKELESFWTDISEEEVNHSDILKQAEKSMNEKSRSELFEKNKYAFGIISYVSTFIDQELEKAKARKTTPTEAIDTALRLEQSMIEEKCFEIFSPKEKELKKIMEKLNEETKGHIKKLRKMSRKIGTKMK